MNGWSRRRARRHKSQSPWLISRVGSDLLNSSSLPLALLAFPVPSAVALHPGAILLLLCSRVRAVRGRVGVGLCVLSSGCGLSRGSERAIGPPSLPFPDVTLLHLYVGFSLGRLLSAWRERCFLLTESPNLFPYNQNGTGGLWPGSSVG